jgi:hypothetical protein
VDFGEIREFCGFCGNYGGFRKGLLEILKDFLGISKDIKRF